MITENPFSKELEEEERKYIPPDYSEAAKKAEEDEDDDDDFEDLDDLDDEDPAEDEEILNIRESLPEVADESGDLPFDDTPEPPVTTQPRPFFNQQNQRQMSWNQPSSQPWGGQPQSSWQPPGSSNPWAPKPTGGTGIWGGGSQSTPWGSSTTLPGQQMQELDRRKRIILCDVLDCLICTLEGAQKVGLIPRDIWDVQLRLDVFHSLRRFSYIERIYAMIPKDLIQNSTSPDNWQSLLDYVARALASYLRIPSQAVQILTQSFIAQPKDEMVKCVVKGIPTNEIVYIGTQSGGPGQSSVDIDCANELNIDYIDLGNFLLRYS